MKWLERFMIVLACALSVPAWAAQAELLDSAQLAEVLKKGQPCCVIDAREEGHRKQQPIPFAVIYNESIKPKAGGFAVVVGDNDRQALAAAQVIVKRSGQDVFAVKGGYAAWKRAQSGGKAPSGEPDTIMPQNFTIPSNTCEPGEALHEYK
ncbi:MAG: rhodanese-like domain-containing protein [Sulfuricella sp.]|jgi:rhodanese-related sulfurtransferase|nr:rhodanese-like domain-containing protein [Sulfuricella sp.]